MRISHAVVLGVALVVLTLPASVSGSERVYINSSWWGGKPHMAYRPHALRYITGDGTAFLTGLDWRGWNKPLARANAYFHEDDCSPSCAEGSWSRRKVRVTAYRVRECQATGKRIYTRLRIPGSNIGGSGPTLDMSHDCDEADASAHTASAIIDCGYWNGTGWQSSWPDGSGYHLTTRKVACPTARRFFRRYRGTDTLLPHVALPGDQRVRDE